MTYRFDKEGLANRLGRMPGWKGLAFGITLLERALPGYRAFEVETGVRGMIVLEGALAKAWAVLRSAAASASEVSAAMCEGVAPDTEDYSSEWTSAALDAAIIAAELMEFIKDGNVEHLAMAAIQRHETCDMLAQDSLGPPEGNAFGGSAILANYIERILSHPIVQQELAAQDDALALLETLGDDRLAALSAIESRLRP